MGDPESVIELAGEGFLPQRRYSSGGSVGAIDLGGEVSRNSVIANPYEFAARARASEASRVYRETKAKEAGVEYSDLTSRVKKLVADRDSQIRAYEEAADRRIADFVKTVRNHLDQNWRNLNLGKLTPVHAKKLNDLTGRDYSGFSVVLESDGVRHIETRHGTDGIHDKSMADEAELARFPYVMKNFDEARLSPEKNSKYKNSDETPADVVILSKKVNGYYHIVEAVPDAKKRTIFVVSAYKSGDDTGLLGGRMRASSGTTPPSGPTSDNAPKLTRAASDENNIQQPADKVNGDLRETASPAAADVAPVKPGAAAEPQAAPVPPEAGDMSDIVGEKGLIPEFRQLSQDEGKRVDWRDARNYLINIPRRWRDSNERPVQSWWLVKHGDKVYTKTKSSIPGQDTMVYGMISVGDLQNVLERKVGGRLMNAIDRFLRGEPDTAEALAAAANASEDHPRLCGEYRSHR